MQNKNDSDWKFTVRLCGFATHNQISRGLRHVLLVLHSCACLLMGHIKNVEGPRIISRDLSGQPTRGHVISDGGGRGAAVVRVAPRRDSVIYSLAIEFWNPLVVAQHLHLFVVAFALLVVQSFLMLRLLGGLIQRELGMAPLLHLVGLIVVEMRGCVSRRKLRAAAEREWRSSASLRCADRKQVSESPRVVQDEVGGEGKQGTKKETHLQTARPTVLSQCAGRLLES